MTNEAPAYVASPATGTGLPVLLLHTWWGLNQPIKNLADGLAGDGFTVMAPDLFEGTVLTTIEDADAHGQKMDSEYERILGLVRSALDDLLAHPDAHGEHAGIVALSFGAWYARQVAEARPQVTALVSIYAHVYAGTKHWFMEDDRPEYDAAATELAYARTVEFLRQHLA